MPSSRRLPQCFGGETDAVQASLNDHPNLFLIALCVIHNLIRNPLMRIGNRQHHDKPQRKSA